MAQPESSAALPLAFRIGVTGTREFAAAVEPKVRAAVADILRSVRTEIERLAGEDEMGRVYQRPQGRVVPLLRILSPLAEGTDRLVAEEALKQGYVLDVILPFRQQEYERDFPESLERFRTLLAHAGDRILALDGARGADEWRSYEAVGRLVVRNCDLLIAVWDDSLPPKGRGGTEDTIRFAAAEGPPICWIHASGSRPPALIETAAHMRDLSTAPSGEAARARLLHLLGLTFRPPRPPIKTEGGVFDRLVETLQRVTRSQGDPLLAYMKERATRRRGLRIYNRFLSFVARGAKTKHSSATPGASGALSTAVVPAEERFWDALYGRADRNASHYADRYRNAYFFVIVFGALGLAMAAFSLGFAAWHLGAAGLIQFVETLSVVMIFLLVVLAQVRRWHERWIGYRLLAELCRKQLALTSLGWSLPAFDISQSGTAVARRNVWINWYFDAAMRAAPLPKGWLAGRELERARDRIEQILVAGQIDYHFNRRASSEEAARVLGNIGDFCFLATAVGIVLGFVFTEAWGTGVEVVSVVLAAVSGAMLGVRAFSELEVIADQSERMEGILAQTDARLGAVDLNRGLASQDLGNDLYLLALAMLADVSGWVQLFRMKVVSAG